MASSDNWTFEENERFEDALVVFDEKAPDRWSKLVAAVGGTKTEEDVKLHFQRLVDDIELIESGKWPLPDYKDEYALRHNH
ncbi:hypothetical protein SASPL_106282 [Salvia splendens]|uniref:Myb-like domain-containing protein n=1 Tax=Salvia splendens TaxID=180675 RepID=A0A8X9A9F8_SALSN|nr:hypothetical protein SASPL_106282 [Salvia splendens]